MVCLISNPSSTSLVFSNPFLFLISGETMMVDVIVLTRFQTQTKSIQTSPLGYMWKVSDTSTGKTSSSQICRQDHTANACPASE